MIMVNLDTKTMLALLKNLSQRQFILIWKWPWSESRILMIMEMTYLRYVKQIISGTFVHKENPNQLIQFLKWSMKPIMKLINWKIHLFSERKWMMPRQNIIHLKDNLTQEKQSIRKQEQLLNTKVIWMQKF